MGDCKSRQAGFGADWMLDNDQAGAVRQRRYFKALAQDIWADGLAMKVEEEFGTRKFTYVIYCTRADSYSQLTATHRVPDNPTQVVTLADIVRKTVTRLGSKGEQSVEPTTLGRFLQLLEAAGVELTVPP